MAPKKERLTGLRLTARYFGALFRWTGLRGRAPPAADILIGSKRPKRKERDDDTDDDRIRHCGRDIAEAQHPWRDHQPDAEDDVAPLFPRHDAIECEERSEADHDAQ